MEKIENTLLEISKTLKEIRDNQKEDLAFRKESEKEDREVLGAVRVYQDKMIGKIGKDEQITDEILKQMGIKKPIEEIEIDSLEEIDDDKPNGDDN